jgi:serine/threonine protein kinase
MADMLSCGTVLDDRYTIVRIIAEGGMSVVYEVEDGRLGGRMALKQMRELLPGSEEGEQLLGQFKREAEVLSTLGHVNLPRVIDYFIWEGKRFLVQELIEGKTLEELMEEKSPRGEDEVIAWALQICDALEYLHGQTMVYRDLKPSNCILTPQGVIKLIDFGLVRFFAMGKPKDTVIMGTPGYAAPEQYGQQETDPRSDIFSLGVLIHHLLTGHDPTKTPFMFPDARSLNPHLSEEVEQALWKAYALDPAARFQNVDEMRRVLRREQVIFGEAESFAYAGAPPSPKNYALSLLACLAGGGLGLILLVQNPMSVWFATLLLSYTPFWLWLLGSDYRQKMREGKVAIIATEQGISYKDDRKRLFLKWHDIKSLEFVKDRFSMVKKAKVDTAKGVVAFTVSAEEGRLFESRSIANAERLCEILITQSRLKRGQPGTEMYVKR